MTITNFTNTNTFDLLYSDIEITHVIPDTDLIYDYETKIPDLLTFKSISISNLLNWYLSLPLVEKVNIGKTEEDKIESFSNLTTSSTGNFYNYIRLFKKDCDDYLIDVTNNDVIYLTIPLKYESTIYNMSVKITIDTTGATGDTGSTSDTGATGSTGTIE